MKFISFCPSISPGLSIASRCEFITCKAFSVMIRELKHNLTVSELQVQQTRAKEEKGHFPWDPEFPSEPGIES